ncbi:MAG: lytic transglycosylase domain-containing protein [Vampirovibrio sp.]
MMSSLTGVEQRMQIIESKLGILQAPPVPMEPLSEQTAPTEGNPSFSALLQNVMGDSKPPPPVSAGMTSLKALHLDPIVEEYAGKAGVSSSLVKAVIKAESGGNPRAISAVGAQGLMQLMPATAKSLGVEDPFNAEANIAGGSQYLGQLMKKYHGNKTLALAAYNAGSGAVAKYGGVPPFPETQNYVKKVLQYEAGL